MDLEVGDGLHRYYSNIPSGPESAFYEPLVTSFGSVTRAVSMVPGTIQIGDITVALSNATLEFSRLLADYVLQTRPATIKIGLEGRPIGEFQTIFTGQVNSATISGGECHLEIRDLLARKLKRKVGGEITSQTFPALETPASVSSSSAVNTPSIIIPRAPIIYGDNATEFGRIPCQFVGVDTNGKYQFVLARHECWDIQVFVYGGTGTETYDAVVDLEPLSPTYGWHFLLFDQDPGVGDGSSLVVSANAKGLKDNGGTVITCAVDALKHYLLMWAGYTAEEIDTASFDAVNVELSALGYTVEACIINQETHEDVVAMFQKCFSISVYTTVAGKIGFAYNHHHTDANAPQLNHIDHVLEGSLVVGYNGEVFNKSKSEYNYFPVDNEFKSDITLENKKSSEHLGDIYDETNQLEYLTVDSVAEEVTGIRLFWSAEDRMVGSVTAMAPVVPSGVDITKVVRLTHYAGISASGWVDKQFKITGIRYNLESTPTVTLDLVEVDLGTYGYRYYDTVPSVENLTCSEDASSIFNLEWTLSGAANDPTSVSILYKDPAAKNYFFAGKVAAADLAFSFTPSFPAGVESNSIKVIAVSEDARGITNEYEQSPFVIVTDRTRFGAVSGLAADAYGTAIELDWSDIANPNSNLKCYWVKRGTTPAEADADLIADNLQESAYKDEGLTVYSANGVRYTYYYWVYAITKSSSKGTKATVSAQLPEVGTGGPGPDPTLPVYDQPPKVTGFSVTEESMVVDANGSLKSRVAVLFSKPDETADPDGVWKTAKIYRGKLIQSSGYVSGDQGATAGGTTTMFDVVADLTESAAVILEPWAESSVFAAVSTAVKNNVAVEGRVDSLWSDAANYQPDKLWAELGATGKFAQSFLLDESRPIARWDLWLKRTGNSFTSDAKYRLKVVNDCAQGPDEASVIAASTEVQCTSLQMTDTGGWISFRFPTPASLLSGVKYWIVLEPTGTYASEFQAGALSVSLAYCDDGTLYQGGEGAVKVDDTWAVAPDLDVVFRNYTLYYPRVVLTIAPSGMTWLVQNLFVTSLAAGRSDGFPTDAFTITWEIPAEIDPAAIACFDLAYSSERGFNADVQAIGTPAEVTRVNGLDGNMRTYYRSDPVRTCFFAMRARRKDGAYTNWTYFGEAGCDANPSLRTPVTTYSPIGQIIVEPFRLYSYGFCSGKLFPNPAFPGVTPRGFEINSDGSAEFNEVFIRTAATAGTVEGGMIYSGLAKGDYEKEWYGVFMNASGLVGRQNIEGNSSRNPPVFLLGAADYDHRCLANGGDWPGDTDDPVHPSIGGGDFCVSSDVKRAYEYGDVPFLLFRPRGYQNDHATTLSQAVDSTSAVWHVHYAVVFGNGDYVMCGAEICRVESVDFGAGTITLSNTNGVRNRYFNTFAAPHSLGDMVGTVTEGPTLKIRGQVDIIGNSTISGVLGITGETYGLWIGDTSIGTCIAMNGLGIGLWSDYPHTTENLGFALWAKPYSGTLPGPNNTNVAVSALPGDVWIRRAFVGPAIDNGGNSICMEITPTSIQSANYAAGPTGAGFKLFTDGTAEFQRVKVRMSENPYDHHLLYAGSMENDYRNDWYGIFMSSRALLGRFNSGDINNPTNPVVFLLAAASYVKYKQNAGGDFDNTSLYSEDPVLPNFIQGDFCIADNVKTAYENPSSSSWYLKASRSTGLELKGNFTINSSQLGGSGTPHIHLTGDGIIGHDAGGYTRFVLSNVDMNSVPIVPGVNINIAAGTFGAWNGIIGGILIDFDGLRGSYTPGSAGFAINSDGTAEFQSVKVRAGGAPSGSDLVYAGSMSGDYQYDWYGVFMSSVALAGRRNVAGAFSTNPVVFLLAAENWSGTGGTGDAVLPAFAAGDFCIATNVKDAYSGTAAAYLKFTPADGILTIKGNVVTPLGGILNGDSSANWDLIMWAGSSYANRAGAPFQVTDQGNVFAGYQNIYTWAGVGTVDINSTINNVPAFFVRALEVTGYSRGGNTNYDYSMGTFWCNEYVALHSGYGRCASNILKYTEYDTYSFGSSILSEMFFRMQLAKPEATPKAFMRLDARLSGPVTAGDGDWGFPSVTTYRKFQINDDGNLACIRELPYEWPTANAAGVLTNDGNGNLSWA